MMVFGICGMIGEWIVNLIRGNIDAFDWMVFAIWALWQSVERLRRRDSGVRRSDEAMA